MSAPVLNPNLPLDNSPIRSGELRDQFQGIADTFTLVRNNFMAVGPLGLTVSDPPTQAEVQSIADKIDELIGALQNWPV